MKKLLFALAVCAAVWCAVQLAAAQTATLPNLTSRDYSSMKKDDVYVVMFTAAYCRPCLVAKREMFPALRERFAQDANVHFYALDVEKDVPAQDGSLLKNVWGVNALPTFVVVYNDAVMLFERGYSPKTAAALKQNIINKVNALK